MWLIKIKSIVGKSETLIPEEIYLLGPIPNGPAVFDKKGSVKIFLFPSLIKKAAWPSHVMLILSLLY